MHTRDQIRCVGTNPLRAGFPDPNLCLLAIIRDWARKCGRNLPSYWEMSGPCEPFAQFCADVSSTGPAHAAGITRHRCATEAKSMTHNKRCPSWTVSKELRLRVYERYKRNLLDKNVVNSIESPKRCA